MLYNPKWNPSSMLKDSLPNISKNVLKVLSVFISKIYTDLTFAFKQLKRKDVEEF